MQSVDRRTFLRLTAGVSLAFAGLHRFWSRSAHASLLTTTEALGPLQPEPGGLLELPPGFSCHTFSSTGATMSDGLIVPGQHDGMAAFPGPRGTTVLIRNHEITHGHKTVGPFGPNHDLIGLVDQSKIYDPGRTPLGTPFPCRGGCTRLVYDTANNELLTDRLILAGTDYNCAGGPTPRGTWITCEETTAGPEHGPPWTKPHGYCFEVPAHLNSGLVTPEPIKPMGRFRHEAVGVNPDTGIVYMTEDIEDGLLYRYLPEHPDRLNEGGRLQALALAGLPSADTRDWEGVPPIHVGQQHAVEWLDIEEADSADDSLRYQGFEKGAARFARAEGMWHGKGEVFFACTTGGRAKAGQLWRYVPAPPGIEGTTAERDTPGRLELFLQPDDASVLENADNITQSPGGDLIVCEDGPKHDYLLGITPQGQVYPIARHMAGTAEFAGCCFSPDGRTLFVNLQRPGVTIAIKGPWRNQPA
ncbi:MAG: PhoX family protein [Phycisphaerales bacterium]|nr:PhoX family protein [Phycisphaerales bacterium]